MSGSFIVLDANVAVKMLHDEPDSDQAKEFFRSCGLTNTRLFVPEHFLYELVNVGQRVGASVEVILELFDTLNDTILTVVTPQKSVWLAAEEITLSGHPKSGFPTMYDSIYQALAIELGATFITADKRHFAKAEQAGSIQLLSDWFSSAKK